MSFNMHSSWRFPLLNSAPLLDASAPFRFYSEKGMDRRDISNAPRRIDPTPPDTWSRPKTPPRSRKEIQTRPVIYRKCRIAHVIPIFLTCGPTASTCMCKLFLLAFNLEQGIKILQFQFLINRSTLYFKSKFN